MLGIDRSKIRRILIVRLSALGDVINTLPVLRPLRSTFPDAHIAWLAESEWADLLDGHPLLNDVILLERKQWQKQLLGLHQPGQALADARRFFSALRRRRFDLVVDFQGNLRSGVAAWLTGAPVRVGFDRGAAKEFSYLFANRRVPLDGRAVHRVERNLALLASVVGNVTDEGAELFIPPADEEYIDRFLGARRRGRGPLVVIHPGVSRFGVYKRWPAERFAELAEELYRAKSADLVLTWGPGERPLVQEIAAQAPHTLVGPQTSSLKQLAALLRRGALFVGCDTGPTHLAALVGTPVVALYGPKDPKVYGPHRVRHRIAQKDLPCRPCTRRVCDDPKCMTQISVGEVLEAALSLLEPTDDRERAPAGLPGESNEAS